MTESHYRVRNAIMAITAATTLMLTAACTGVEAPASNDGAAASITASETLEREEGNVQTEFDTSRELNLLSGMWQYMPGAEVQDGALAVHRTGEAILLKPDDGPGPESPDYAPNAPVNLYGTHLEMMGGSDVGFSAHISRLDGAATLSFHSQPPVRYDERIVRHPGVDVTVAGDAAVITVYTEPTALGPSGQDGTIYTIALDEAAHEADVIVAQQGEKLIISVNGSQYAIDAKLFESQIWFGADTTGTFRIDDFSAYPIGDTQTTMVDMSQVTYNNGQRSPNGLAALAEQHGYGGDQLGTAVELGELLTNPEYAQFVVENFNEIQTEIGAKFQALQPEEGRFEFAELDALVDFATRHGIEVHGHALIFGEANPQWLVDKLQHATPAEAQAIMQNHITTVMSRYDGQHGYGEIKYWDVVNEPFDPDDWQQLDQNNLWYKAMGPGYIAAAFQAARAANPDAILGFNDWAFDTDDDRWQGGLDLLDSLRAMGVKVDFVGIQSHMFEDDLADEDIMSSLRGGMLRDRFQELADRGVMSRISELSVAENGDPDTQAEVFDIYMRDCLQAPNCLGVNLWGATNSSKSYAYFTGNILDEDPGNDAPTVQDANGAITPRPAWSAMIAAVSQP